MRTAAREVEAKEEEWEEVEDIPCGRITLVRGELHPDATHLSSTLILPNAD